MAPLGHLKSGLRRFLFIWGLFFSFATPRAEAVRDAVVCPPEILKDGLGNVSLFSAISLKDSDFAALWSAQLPELKTLFPSLIFENPKDLHLSEIYMGYDWDPNQVAGMEQLALVSPPVYPVTFQGTPAVFGGSCTYVVLALNPVDSSWAKQIVNNISTLTKLGFRKPDAYDDSFSPHITLAAAQGIEANSETSLFQQWLMKNAPVLKNLKLTLNSSNQPLFLISNYKFADQYYFPFHDICR